MRSICSEFSCCGGYCPDLRTDAEKAEDAALADVEREEADLDDRIDNGEYAS